MIVLLPLVKGFYSSSGGQDAATSPLGGRFDIWEEADRRAQREVTRPETR